MKQLFEYFIEDNFNLFDKGTKKLRFPIQVLLSLFEQFEGYYIYEEGLRDYFTTEEIDEGFAYYVYAANQDLINWEHFPPVMPHTIDSPFDEDEENL